MTLLTETNPLLNFSGKRKLLQADDHLTHNSMPPTKRPTVNCTRTFPRFCGPEAPAGPSGFPDSSDADASGSPEVPIAAVPLTILPPAVLHSDFDSSTSNFKYRGTARPSKTSNRCNNVLSVEDDEDEDCVIIENKNNENSMRNGSNVLNACTSFSGKSAAKSPLESKIDSVEYEEQMLVLSSSEWGGSRSGYTRQKGSRDGIAVKVETEQKFDGECSHGGFGQADRERIVVDSDEEVEGQDLRDLSIVCYDGGESSACRQQVLNALKVFEELYQKFLQENLAELKGGRENAHVYNKAASILKNEKKWVNAQPRIGHVPGVEIGDQFEYRAELAVIGLHHQYIAGINFMTIDGQKCAVSIVDSGRYNNKTISSDSFVYSGHGGNQKLQKEKVDQKLESGNLALKNSMDRKYPVRVIRKHVVGGTGKKIYIYEGLYIVKNFWQDRLENGQLTFTFEMIRFSGDPESGHHSNYHITKNEHLLFKGYQHRVLDDLSNGKEKHPIRVVNEINDEKPPPFTYITEMKYPEGHHLTSKSGCNCINGCSDFELCRCGIKNGGELPFNEEGCIMRVLRLVHECGLSCKCPSSCQNRVGQRGPHHRLEVFKTKSTGWGVRSPDEIPSGSFICEYIGELLPDKEAEERVDNDEYLFELDDKDGFTIDALKYGNVGRFINHSCSPNLCAVNVVYGNEDERSPHIMFFATKKIPPLRELTYDYNYKIGRVCDAYGNTKTKICRCGSRQCAGRLY